MGKLVAIVLALTGGLSVGLQSMFNSVLGRAIGNVESTFVSFVIGGTAAGILTVVAGTGDLLLVTKTSPVLLIGGLLGVIIVFATLSSIQVLGTVTALTLSIIGQLVMAVIIDHFGLLGLQRIPLDWHRLVGIALLIVAGRLIIK